MKKFWTVYFTSTLLFICIVIIFAWLALPIFLSENLSLASPLPSSLSITKNSQVTTLDIWSPIKNFLEEGFFTPQLSAKSALSYDFTTERMLFSKNSEEKLPFASLTKIMTAIIALEHSKSNDNYTVTQDDLVGEDSMGLSVGEVLSLKDLLYGMILHSGNDAAETIATNFPGGRSSFIEAMNEKALSIGLKNTHFTNPTGLEGDGDQHTTAYDLLVMTRYALENFQTFREVVSTFDYNISQNAYHKEYDLENETNLLTSYPGVKGVKTGYTPQAGLCLVTYLEYKDHKIIAVLLGSDNRREEMKEILDYSLKEERINPPYHS